MSTFVVASGTVDPQSEITRREVGEDKKKVCNFRIATDPGWYSVAAWGDLGAKVPAPGTFIIVTGKLSGRSYDKDVNGTTIKMPVVEIVASTIEVIGAAVAAPVDESLFE